MRWGRMHKGIDFGAGSGAPIRAIGDGVVIGAGYQGEESGYGQITLIRHSNGMVSAYAHQSGMLVHAGERVSAGELIGYVGSTGHVTGPHLHFEIRTEAHGGQVNPRSWLAQHGVFV
jgi:murein DD-endopeptidase MepM/ murein hydrolase activator NlpD